VAQVCADFGLPCALFTSAFGAPHKPIEATEVARKLAVLADREPASVQVTGEQVPAPQGAIHRTSYLAPVDSMLERFVRERRHARQLGEAAVERRDDEVRMEDAV